MPGCHAGGDPKGVRVDIRQVNTPGAPTPNALTNIGLPVEMSEINLIEEIPEPMTASRGYAPNLKTLESGDEMMGPLLDMTG